MQLHLSSLDDERCGPISLNPRAIARISFGVNPAQEAQMVVITRIKKCRPQISQTTCGRAVICVTDYVQLPPRNHRCSRFRNSSWSPIASECVACTARGHSTHSGRAHDGERPRCYRAPERASTSLAIHVSPSAHVLSMASVASCEPADSEAACSQQFQNHVFDGGAHTLVTHRVSSPGVSHQAKIATTCSHNRGVLDGVRTPRACASTIAPRSIRRKNPVTE